MRQICEGRLYNGSFWQKIHAVGRSSDGKAKQVQQLYKKHFDHSVRFKLRLRVNYVVDADWYRLP